MAVILKDSLIEEIEASKSRLNKSKLESSIDLMFKHMTDSTIVNASVQDKDNADRKEEVVNNFRKAWNYSFANYPGSFQLDYLQDVAGRVEPSFCLPGRKYAEFRDSGALLKASEYHAPADKARIMENLERVLKSLKENEFHPLEASLFTYFHLMRIQPFGNGNKRTANVIANTMLNKDGFLPISVSSKEAPLYNDYLIGAIHGFLEQGAKGTGQEYLAPDHKQAQFYDFMARKELSALRSAEDVMRGLHEYRISFDTNNPAPLYGVKHAIAGWFKARSSLYQERLNANNRELTIMGNIPSHVLEKIIRNHSKGIKSFKIEDKGTH